MNQQRIPAPISRLAQQQRGGEEVTIVDVLSEHRDIAWNHETGQAICGDCDAPLGPKEALMEEQDRWMREHQAAELTAAGFGKATK